LLKGLCDNSITSPSSAETKPAGPNRLDWRKRRLGHLGGVVFKAKMRPHKVKRAVAVGLDVAGGHAVDLLLKDHAGKQS
jgi:hypothetical protein